MTTYRKKSNPFSPPLYIQDKNDRFITLSNGESVLTSAFNELYEEVLSPITENTDYQNISISNETVDAGTFFKSTKINLQTNENTKQTNTTATSPYVDNQPVTRIDNTQSPAPITKIDNATDKDELFEDEIQLYGIEEATKRKIMREKTNGGNQIKNNNNQFNINNPPQQTSTYTPQAQMNPSEMMFKTFKRNHEITITLEYKDKIGNPDFVKMMLENIDGDIVQYYKNLIMDNIMKNIGDIEKKVEDQIRIEIFGNKKIKKTKQPINKEVKGDNSNKKNNFDDILNAETVVITETVVNTDDIINQVKKDTNTLVKESTTFVPSTEEVITNPEDCQQIVKDNTNKKKVKQVKSEKKNKK